MLRVVPADVDLLDGFLQGLGDNIPTEEEMRTILAVRWSWVRLAGLLLAAAVLLSAAKLDAQAAPTTEFSQNVKDVFFPFDVHKKVIPSSVPVLDSNADWLKQHPDWHLWVQGYADIRGDIFYNLVLSYRRAQFVKTSLTNRGVESSRIDFATGWGKLYPVCDVHDEACFQKNRYVEIVKPQMLMLPSM
jgi:peptidoglycan-associated lipoprotein